VRTLYVLRHAKSDWGDASLRDFDRPLNGRGRKSAKAMGRELRERGLTPDLVLLSPSARTTETLARVEEGFGASFEKVEERSIYLAETEELVALIRNAPAQSDRLMIVGHNPGMHELVLLLANGPRDLREEAAAKFPTGAMAEISFDVGDWSDVTPGSGFIRSFLKPREL
jgi:phosphohistidine phosphatase